MSRLPILLALIAITACRPGQGTGSNTNVPAETPGSVEEILAASDLPPTIERPLDGDAMAATVHRLKNGLTVYVSTDRQKPRFVAWIVVRSGSRNDPANSTGLAHYLEHMLFKGTDEYGTLDISSEREHLDAIAGLYARLRETQDSKERAAIFAEIDRRTQLGAEFAIPNELDRLYASLGVESVNAFTSDEITAYISDVPANRLDAWAKIEAERFADPVFRLFFPELEAVYEEKNLSLDSPEERVQEEMLRALFPAHPYGTQPTLGVVEHLKTPAYQDMVQYFADWYAPNNMAIVLAGDIDAAKALPVLEATLGKLEPSPLGRRTEATLLSSEGRVLREVKAEGEQSVTLAWKGVDGRHADEPVFHVLDWLMDNSRSGMLNTELELTQKVPDAGSWSESELEAGYFGIQARLRDDQNHAEVEALLLEVVAKLRRGEFDPGAVEAIKLHERIREKQELESNWGRAARLSDSFISRRNWADMLARDGRLQKVSREDVIRVANAYLGEDFVVVHRKHGKPSLPKIDKPKITPVEIDTTRESPFAQAIARISVSPLEPEWLRDGTHYSHLQLPAGPMVAASNSRNDLFTLEYHFERGRRDERLLCLALSLLERSGSGTTSAEDLQKRLYALGTRISFSCDADESGVHIQGVDANLEESLRLLDTWFRDATFSADDLKKLKETTISNRRDQLEDSDTVAWALSEYTSLGNESAFLAEPSNADVSKAKAERLSNLLAGFLDYGHRTLYFGPRASEAAAKVVGLGAHHRPTKKRKPLRYRKQRDSVVFFLHKDVAKSTISVAMPLAPLARDKKPASHFLGHYLGGGMSSPIFQEIREARGLAYYAFGFLSQGERMGDDWAFVGGMGTQGDKTVDALRTYLHMIRERPIDPQRLGHARESLEQEFRASRIDPRSITSAVLRWDLQGETEDPRPWLRERIGTLGAADLDALLDECAARPMLIGIVGDRAIVDLTSFGKIAPVREVKVTDIFSYGAFPKPVDVAAKIEAW